MSKKRVLILAIIMAVAVTAESQMVDILSLLGSALAAAFVYWVVSRALRHSPVPWRRKVFLWYATLHIGSWLAMHILVAVPFCTEVRATHADALASIPQQIARYRSWEPRPDPEYIRSIERGVSARPWCSVWSVAPIPFVLVSSENCQMGPLCGSGMTRVHVWVPASLRCVWETKTWVS